MVDRSASRKVYTLTSEPQGSKLGSSSRPQARLRLSEKALFYLIAFVAAAAPLPFGSTEPAIVGVWCGVLAFGLGLAALARIGRAQVRILLLITIMCIGILIVTILQTPIGSQFIRPDPMWMIAGSVLHNQIVPGSEAVRNSSFYSAGPVFAFMSTLTIAIVSGGLGRQQASHLLSIVAWSGLGYAVYGLWATVFTPSLILWADRPGYQGYLTSTFYQRNTAATYFGMISLIWTLRLFSNFKKYFPPGAWTWAHYNEIIFKHPPRPLVTAFGGLVLSFMALMLTGSRAGILISLAVLLLCTAAFLRKNVRAIIGRTRVLIFALVGVLSGLQVFGGVLTQRLQSNEAGVNVETRLALQSAALRIIGDHPWLGTGLGTFPWIFPSYRQMPPTIEGVFPVAYSTPLELAVELGLPMTIAIAVAMIWVLSYALWRAAQSQQRQMMAFAAVFTAVLAVVHSSFDFPLQVPGFAIVAAAVIGNGIGFVLRVDPGSQSRTRGEGGGERLSAGQGV